MFFEYNESAQNIIVLAYAIILSIAIGLKLLIGKKSESIRKIPLLIVGGILVYLEIMKQLRNALGLNYKNLLGLYEWDVYEFQAYGLPFHFCSFFVFWLALQLILIKSKSKIKIFVDRMAFLWSSAIMVLMFVYPSSVYGGAIQSLYEGGGIEHTVVFHLLAFLYWALGVSLRPFKFEIKKWWHVIIAFLLYGLLAIPAAFIFNENYCSILSPDFFSFLMPFYNMGYFVYELVLLLIGIILGLLIYLTICLVQHLRDKVLDNTNYIIGFIFLIPALILLSMSGRVIGYEKISAYYTLLLTLVSLICLLPATIVGHLRCVKSNKTKISNKVD